MAKHGTFVSAFAIIADSLHGQASAPLSPAERVVETTWKHSAREIYYIAQHLALTTHPGRSHCQGPPHHRPTKITGFVRCVRVPQTAQFLIRRRIKSRATEPQIVSSISRVKVLFKAWWYIFN
ncbi:hypothetical protein NA57DRAFT_61495 [Rhizodiscina lignyota]|uniref:Uncharacterized protein n=1 Tax=Rhizodiscina lignyota TaxID=1504668 RepID=A0A9P4M511_9PEZI|nr:hypothetical protein NA57DRAFT_61495 [Rhizodiscina lignyota]